MGIVIVTGASSGIGLATSVRLAAAGHEVYAAMRDLDRADALRDAATLADVDTIHLLPLDVTRDESVERAVKRVVDEQGWVDVLVNNAGISGTSTVEDTDIETYRQMLDTNVLGPLRCAKAVLPVMRSRYQGTIINVSSVAGRLVRPGMSAYAASKHALEAAMEALAAEVARFHVKVALIEPGVVATPIFAKGTPPPEGTHYGWLYERTRAYYRAQLRQPSTPEQVADVIAGVLAAGVPALRYPVGADAEVQLAARAGMTDETWLEMHATEDDRAWARAYAEAMGVTVDL
jgi:NAD(P)-dependent dehydrogenase (short-subunit alcohol dehydrogenase family)